MTKAVMMEQQEEFMERNLLAVRDSRCVRGSERELLFDLTALLRQRADGQWVCTPSYTTLALYIGKSVSTLQAAARRLEGRGLVKRVVRENRSNLWIVNVPKILGLAEDQRAKKQAAVDEIDGFANSEQ